MRSTIAFGLFFWCSAVVGHADEAPEIDSPYALYFAEVVRVIDGDTIDVRVDLWPGLVAEYAVRVRGIDSPELRGALCPEEKAWAEDAKTQVEKLYKVGSIVKLENVAYDAYSGRVDADVRRWRSDRWIYLADELVERDLAEAWTPDVPKIDWCSKPRVRTRSCFIART